MDYVDSKFPIGLDLLGWCGSCPIGPWWGVMRPLSPLLSTCLCSWLLLLGRSVLTTDRAMGCVLGGFRLFWCT